MNFEGAAMTAVASLATCRRPVEYALNHSSLGPEFEKYLFDLTNCGTSAAELGRTGPAAPRGAAAQPGEGDQL